MARLFEAQYRGSCSNCGEPVEPSDWVGYVNDQVCCEDCCKELEPTWTWEAW